MMSIVTYSATWSKITWSEQSDIQNSLLSFCLYVCMSAYMFVRLYVSLSVWTAFSVCLSDAPVSSYPRISLSLLAVHWLRHASIIRHSWWHSVPDNDQQSIDDDSWHWAVQSDGLCQTASIQLHSSVDITIDCPAGDSWFIMSGPFSHSVRQTDTQI